MFVLRIKVSKNRILTFICVLLLLVAVIWIFTANGGATVHKGADRADRIAYLNLLGYKADDSTEIETDIKIPENFNKLYREYNNSQLSAGFNLTHYAGAKAKMFTYSVTNFNGLKSVYANLIVKNGKIIGGDISSIEDGGFTLPLITLKKNVSKLGDK